MTLQYLNNKHFRFHSNFLKVLLTSLLVGLTLATFGQQRDAASVASQYLKENHKLHGLEAGDCREFNVTANYTDAHNEITHIYITQQHKGIDLKGAVMGIHLNEEGEIVHANSRFLPKLTRRLQNENAVISSPQALKNAASHLDLPVVGNTRILEKASGPEQLTLLSDSGISLEAIPAKLIFVETEEGAIRLAWSLEIYELGAQHYWYVQVDAENGVVLQKNDAVVSCDFNHHHHASNENLTRNLLPDAQNIFELMSAQAQQEDFTGNLYRVFDSPVESPNHGDRTLVITNGDPVSSPYGWHYDGLVNYNITKGNNVFAYEDQSGANAGAPAFGGLNLSQLNFDFPLDLTQQPNTYTDAAVTNLFYWNNLIHDIFYHYGFTEVSGNFQTDNLGKGGIGLDAVMAEAQDGGGTNNANFLTLNDGVPGRMQMYLWGTTAPEELVHINSSPGYPNGGLSFISVEAAFGPGVSEQGVSGELVIVEANPLSQTGSSSEGCGSGQGAGLPPANDVADKIVLIDRGNCSFIEKVMGAELGGAVGVVVVNNIPGDPPIAMGGDETGTTILIPSAMISYEDGLLLKDELAAGTVNISLQRLSPPSPMKDGDLDNGIIAHEYGHGISIRLTGGANNTLTCLNNTEQQGEGWSDYFAIYTTMLPGQVAAGGESGRGIGTYVLSEPVTGGGIRPARYSTDLSINPYTYGNINDANIAAPHGVGFVWATMLWEMTWKFIEVYGYSADLYAGNAGNNKALQLIMDGLKLQPCNPSFVDSRDAILTADQVLFGGANQCIIWEAFAKRGLGYSAVAGTPDRGDEIEAFDLPPSCLPTLDFTKTVDQTTAEDGDHLTYTLTVTNNSDIMAPKVRILDPVPAGTSYIQGSASNGGNLHNGVVRFPKRNLHPGQSITRTFSVIINTGGGTDLLFSDNMENGSGSWESLPGLDQWILTTSDSYSGSTAWFASDPDNASNQILNLSEAIDVLPDTKLSFWHKFITEAGFDGGVVEVSNDGGMTWYDLGSQIEENGYTSNIPLANNPLINGFAFAGDSQGWIKTVINLDNFAGQSVSIRFRFSSDVATPGTGWWIDDVDIAANPTFVDNTASFSTNNGVSGQASASTLVVVPGSNLSLTNPDLSESVGEEAQLLEGNLGTFSLEAYPNPARDYVNLVVEGLKNGKVQVQIMTLTGQEIQNEEWTTRMNKQSITQQINTSNLTKGTYILQVTNEEETKVLRLTVQ